MRTIGTTLSNGRLCKCGCGERFYQRNGRQLYVLSHQPGCRTKDRGAPSRPSDEDMKETDRVPYIERAVYAEKPESCEKCGSASLDGGDEYSPFAEHPDLGRHWRCLMCGWRKWMLERVERVTA